MSSNERFKTPLAAPRRPPRLTIVTSLAILTINSLSCQQADPPSGNGPASHGQAEIARTFEGPVWDVFYLQDAPAGYSVTCMARHADRADLVVWSQEMELKIRRFSQDADQKLGWTSTEGADGRLVECAWWITSGDQQVRWSAIVDGDTLKVTTETTGRLETNRLPWQADWGGFYGVEQSLLRQPPQPGEKRSLKVLAPMLGQVVQVELQAHDWEETGLLEGESAQRLLRTDSTIVLSDGGKMTTTFWLNSRGEPLKSHENSLNHYQYRTTPAKAREIIASAPPADLGWNTVVSVADIPDDVHTREQMTYQLLLKNGSVRDAVPECPQQSWAEHSASGSWQTLTVHKCSTTTERAKASAGDQPTDNDRRPNGFVQSNDPRVVALANEFLKNDSPATPPSDSWNRAVVLEKQVAQFIVDKDYQHAFLSAVDVLENRHGDCTEHAVLLAALLRSQEIPARVAMGLVYVPTSKSFAFHMWTEAWVHDRWLGLDATLGLGGIGCGHIKLSNANLSDDNAFSFFLPLLHVVGQLEIRVHP